MLKLDYVLIIELYKRLKGHLQALMIKDSNEKEFYANFAKKSAIAIIL